ncbi:MAG: PAS domain-containing sensor histidine kinase, partial [Cyanobacteria bacterium P01_H01_bin.58]
MDTVSGGILLVSAIAGGSLGWLLRGGRHNLRAPTPFPPSNRIEQSQAASVSKLDLATQPQQLKETLLSQAPIAYLEVDDENQLLWSNQLACQILGIPSEDTYNPATPRLLLELVRSYELDQLIEKTRQTQTLFVKDWILHRVSPDPINPTESVSYPLRGHGIPLGKHIGVFLENRQEATTLVEQRNRWISDVA